MSWMQFGKKAMDMFGQQGGGGGGGGMGKYSDTTDLWKNGMDTYQDMSTTPMGLMDAVEYDNPRQKEMAEEMSSAFAQYDPEPWDISAADAGGMRLDGYQDRAPDPSAMADNPEADGMFGWLQKKYPEMAEMGTGEQLAFLKSKGAIGSGVYHGAKQANALGQSQSQGADMMGSMGGLMKQAMGGGGQANKKQIEIGLMGGGQRRQNPWGLMGG